MPIFSDPEMLEIFEGFLIETQELLDSFSNDLMILENQSDDIDLLNQIFRSIHTIKGTSSFMGFIEIADISHHAEDVLNKLRRSELTVTRPIIDVLLEVHDWIALLIKNIETEDQTIVDYQATIDKLDKIKNPDSISDSNANSISPEANSNNNNNKNSAIEAVISNPDITEKPGDFTDDELALLEAAFAEVNEQFKNGSSNNENNDDSNNNNQTIINEDTNTSIDNSLNTINNEIINNSKNNNSNDSLSNNNLTANINSPDNHKQQTHSKVSSDTIRVDVNRVETLMDLSGELVLGRNRLAQLTNAMQGEENNKDVLRDLIETTTQIDFITSEIQAAIMRMRMVPIAKLYQKAPRIVRDLSKEFNKKINLVVKGEETEIDRGIIEELNDPLVHMIRNSCDHGIESTEERIIINKPETGTITLDAYQEGNNIVIKISDDGKGMDPEKLKAKAIEKELISEEQAQTMAKREVFQLIFAPGFSTAAKVSSVSGRGVGMDVVRTNIQNLKGIIEIESELGIGTTFIIKLPLTLAIIQGLLVKVCNEKYAIPLSNVVEVVSLNSNSINSINQQEVIRLRNEVYPLIRLDYLLDTPQKNNSLDNRYVVVVAIGLQRIGFVVDELLGQQEIVIKSLGKFLGHIQGIAGSTILGDGNVIMIIDVAELIEQTYSKSFIN